MVNRSVKTVEQGTVEELAREDLMLAYDQRVALVAEAQGILESLAIGLTRWRAQGWTFSDEDMTGADGSSWRRVPKLGLMLSQLSAIRHALEWQKATIPMAPLWCSVCDPQRPGRNFLQNECIDHDASPSSSISWIQLFGGP